MSRFRTHWLALLGGVALLSLSISSVLGNSPASGDPNRGQQVSTFVHQLLAGDEQSDEQSDEDADQDEDTNEDSDEQSGEDGAGQPDNHGACVSKVAMNPDEVGPPNDNHGGAVQQAARVDCWEELSGDEGADGEAPTNGPAHGGGHGHGGGGKP
jgi:hypothetical protein